MNRILGKLTVNRAFLILTLAGFALAGVFAALLLFEDTERLRQIRSDDLLIDLTTAVGEAAHELQKERGLSAGFLASQSTEPGSGLIEQRKNADAAVDRFSNLLATINSDYAPFNQTGVDALNLISGLPDLRAAVDARRIDHVQAVEDLTRLNQTLFNLTADAARDMYSAGPSRQVMANKVLLGAKDFAGLERTAGKVGFELAGQRSGAFPFPSLVRLKSLVEAQTARYSVFSELAPPDLQAQLREILASPVEQRVIELREIASNGDRDSIQSVSGDMFFEALSAKVDLLHDLEKAAIEDIKLSMSEVSAIARGNLVKHSVILAVCLAVIGAFCLFLIRAVAADVNATAERIGALAEGDAESSIPENRLADLARISAALATFRDAELARREVERKEQALLERSGELIEDVIERVQGRDFSARLPLDELSGASLVLGKGANAILQSADDVVAAQRAEEEAARETEKKEAEAQAKAAEELAAMVASCAVGDFSHRVPVKDKTGIFRDLCEGVNEIATGAEVSLAQIEKCLDAMARGDLTIRMDGNFSGAYARLQSSLNKMIASLTDLIGRISESGANLAASSGELRDTAGELSRQAEKNAAALEETSAALEEISVSVKQVSGNVSEASENAKEARRTAQSSEAVAASAAASMDRIAEASSEIARVVKVIDDIAFQINLLALNAGVEAARAGEAGRGFSVVASEVRSLAQKSSDAAKEIGTVISDSDQAVSEGVENVVAAKSALETIAQSVVRIAGSVDEVATAISEQSTGIGEIAIAMASIDNGTQTQTASFEEITASAALLASEADSLENSIARFKRAEETGSVVKMRERSGAPAAATGGSDTHSKGNAALAMEPNIEIDDWEEF